MIEFSHEKEAISLGDLVRLFARGANWKMPLAQEDWRDLLRHSPLVVTAWKDQQLVGFARLLTDFVRWANLYDVVVDPAFQRQGIGSQLVQRLLDHPRVARVRTVWLGTAEGHAFYERFGFVRDGNGHGMLLVRRDRDDQLAVGPQLAEGASSSPTELRVERPSFIISSREVPEEPGLGDGDDEERQLLEHARRALPQLPDGSRLRVIAGAPHGFGEAYHQVIDTAVGWLVRHLRPNCGGAEMGFDGSH